MNPKPRLFIGSAYEDLPVAEAIRIKLQSTNLIEVTVWNDIGVFNLSNIALSSLFETLKNYDFAVLVASPDPRVIPNPGQLPIPRDNVIYEMGLFAGRLGFKNVFIVIPRDTQLHLATDLAGLTVAYFDPILFRTNQDAAISDVCRRILYQVQALGVDRINAYLGINARNYNGESNSYIVQPSISSIIGQSPFQFNDITDNSRAFSANREIFLAAQNHYSILCGGLHNQAKNLIFNFLRNDRLNHKIRFLFCDPEFRDAVVAWSWVNSETADWRIYRRHLSEAILTMRDWISEASAETPPLKLEARKAYFIPLSVTFIDPDDENASMVIMPHVFERNTPRRPCHYLTRENNPEAFFIYYSNYNAIYSSTTASNPL